MTTESVDIGLIDIDPKPGPSRFQLPLTIRQVDADAAEILGLRPLIEIYSPPPLRRAVCDARLFQDAADGKTAPDHEEIVLIGQAVKRHFPQVQRLIIHHGLSKLGQTECQWQKNSAYRRNFVHAKMQ